MNEFITTQLGLVLGLAKLHKDTVTKARATLEGVLGVERMAQIVKEIDQHIAALEKLAGENNIAEATNKKADETLHHLLVMRDLFVAEKWGDMQVVGEWSGIFEGLAMTRWAVVRGISEALYSIEQSIMHNDLYLLTGQAAEFHYAILHDGMKHFHKTGVDKAKE